MPTPYPESTFEPAIVAGIPQVRNFGRTYPSVQYPYRTSLKVKNSTPRTLTFRVNGSTSKTVGPYTVETWDRSAMGGVVHFYTVDADANMNAGDFTVYENGGLNVAD